MLDFVKERAQEALPLPTKMHWVFQINLGDRIKGVLVDSRSFEMNL